MPTQIHIGQKITRPPRHEKIINLLKNYMPISTFEVKYLYYSMDGNELSIFKEIDFQPEVKDYCKIYQ